MKKKIYLFVIFLILFQSFSASFLYVEAGNDEQPVTCNGPSEMMVNYFDFQVDMEKVLLGSELNVERFSASFGPGGLFTNRVLEFTSGPAINLLSSRVLGNIRSFVSNSITSMVLLNLSILSIAQSNTEGFAILFADRPIVRDYKMMLDIETDLFDIAYFRSKEVDLTHPIDSKMGYELKKVIDKYIDMGLLSGNDGVIRGSVADVLYDLNSMNMVMKQFIMVGGESIGSAGLRKYRGCLGNVDVDNCSDKIALIMFDDKAVSRLYEDYKEVRTFGACNLSVSHFNATMEKMMKNNSDTVTDAIQDVSSALDRLKNVLFEKKRWNFRDPCKDLSDYEIAQLQAYWGGNWQCGKGISLFNPSKYFEDKKAQSQQKKRSSDVTKYATNSVGSEEFDKRLKEANTYQQRAEYFASQMGRWDFNRYYDFSLSSGLLTEMNMVTDEFLQKQENAAASDVISLFGKIKGLLDSLDSVINNAETLKKNLKSIEDRQCK